jgi:hypothetical protein
MIYESGVVKSVNELAQIQQLGQVGDWLGGTITPFMTAISVILLFLTYRSQKDELEAVKKEVKEQQVSQKLQRFEHQFFQHLTFHEQIIDSLKSISEVSPQFGRAYIKDAAGLPLVIRINQVKSRGRTEGEIRDSIGQEVSSLIAMEEHNSFLRRYLSSLEHIYKLIFTLDDKNMSYYINFISNQLTSVEKFILLCYCITNEGRKELAPILETISIFEKFTFEGYHLDQSKFQLMKKAYKNRTS